jgi:hypothetical protein
MAHGSPPGLQHNPLRPLFSMYRRLWTMSDSVFAEVDSFAWVQDWSIERHLTRHVYRDRLFDSLVQCSVCQGVLADKKEKECRVCSGTGHLILIEMPGVEG